MRTGPRAITGALLSVLVVVSGLAAAQAPAGAASAYQVRVSASASRTAPQPLQRATLFGAAYVFLAPTTHVKSVKFYIDDPHRRHSPMRTDSTAPFDLRGGTTKRAGALWTTTLREGTHHLTAAVTSTSRHVTVLQTVFTVRNTPKPPVTSRVVAGDSKVSVFWHSAGAPTRGFNVYRSTSTPVALSHPLNGSKPLSATAASYVDRTAHNATTYRYVVVAVGAHSLRSKPTSTLTARPLPTAPVAPPAPRNVDASADAGLITVNWDSGGGSTSGFNVYRSASSTVALSNPVNAEPLDADVETFTDTVTQPGTYYYVVQAISGGGTTSRSETAQATFGGADIKVVALDPVLYISRNKTTTGRVQVSNLGDATLTVSGIDLSQSTAPYFTPGSFSGFTLDGGESRTLTLTFAPKANGPQRVKLTVHSDDSATPDAFIWVGGLAIDDSVGGEPSLQWIMDAYGLAAQDGDPTPQSYSLNATSLPPAAGILVRGFTARDTSAPVQVTVLAAFAGADVDAARDPSWGWTPQDTAPGSAVASYAVRRSFIGTTYSITPSGRFGIWVKVEGATVRTDLNSSSSPRFLAFPVAGQPGTFVLADDTAGGPGDDWNDVPLLVQNVVTIPASSGG